MEPWFEGGSSQGLACGVGAQCVARVALLCVLCGCSDIDASLLGSRPEPDDATSGMDAGSDSGTGSDADPDPDPDPNPDSGTGSGSDSGADPDAGSDSATDDEDAGTDDDAGVGPPPVDLCPDDPLKLEPGSCGCGENEDDSAQCEALRSSLRHRYRFEGTGDSAPDGVSGADAMLVNTTLDGSGAAVLAGADSDEYVDLPDGIVSALTDATIEVWLSWQGGGDWQRVFDFGTSDAGAGAQGTGTSYLFFTPQADDGAMRVAFTLDGFGNETQIVGDAALDTGMHHVALVFTDQISMVLYVDGAIVGNATLSSGDSLSALTDDNNWLGRSQFSPDPELAGEIEELRIYGRALTAAQIAISHAAGPDAAFLQ
ncbi:MAG: LamG domain-containing protein [Myxococcales bacterium]